MKALVIIDMLDDFVHGALANPRSETIIPTLQRLLAHARAEGWVVVFSNDAHHPDDPELKVWGKHAMAGTPGARVIPELEPKPDGREFASPKRCYGAFEGTGLDERLRTLGVDEVVLAGQHTHICVRHSAYDALIRGYAITVPRDAVCAFKGVDEEAALEYLRTVYAARITTANELTMGSDREGQDADRIEEHIGIAPATRPVPADPNGSTPLGLPEGDLRKGLEKELLRSMHIEGDKPTVHAIAHSVARILERDHLRIAEQLEQAGINLHEPAVEA